MVDNNLEYIDALNDLAKNNDPLVFDNKGSMHASAVMGTMFKHAQEYVCIYANDMNGDISNNHYYQEGLRDFLVRGGKLRLILDSAENYDCVNPSNAAISILKKYDKEGQVCNAIATDDFKAEMIKLAESGKLYHFAVADDKMVRIEEDNVEHKAPFCSFNHPEYAILLRDVFDRHFLS